MATATYSIILVVIGTVFGAFGPIYLKRGSSDFTFNIIKLIRNKDIMLGILFYALATIIFIPALKGGELSVLYPLVALTYIWVALLSVKMLKEKMNFYKWLGVLLIVIGVVFIGLGS